MVYIPLRALRQERERRGWSRNYIAEQIEVDVITVGRWERGERMPHPHHRQKLCALFDMNAQDLGLLSMSPEEPHEEKIVLSQAAEVADLAASTPAEPLTRADPTSNIPPGSQQEVLTHLQPVKTASLLQYPRRRFLLAGLGGLGAIALVGSGLILTSHTSSPSALPSASMSISMPPDKRIHHLLDANTNNFVNYMVWSPDNSNMAVATGSNVISIWSIEKETLILYYPTLNSWVNDISWSKTNVIAAVTADFHNGSLQLWTYPDQKPIFTLRRPYGLRSVSWSPNNKYLAISGRTPTVEIWDPFTARMVSHYTDPALGLMGIRRVKWSASGKFLACATDDGTAHVWEALTGKLQTIYRGHKSRLIDLSWSPDEQYVVSAGTDKTCQVWAAFTGKQKTIYRKHTSAVEGVAWSPHSNYIASGSDDHTVHIWEAFTGKPLIKYEGHHSIVEAVRWSVDGKTLAIGTEKEGVEIWQAPAFSL